MNGTTQALVWMLAGFLCMTLVLQQFSKEDLLSALKAHCQESGKLGPALGFLHFFGTPLEKGAWWVGSRFTQWLERRFPRGGKAWVWATRPVVLAAKKDRERGEALIRRKLAEYDSKHKE